MTIDSTYLVGHLYGQGFESGTMDGYWVWISCRIYSEVNFSGRQWGFTSVLCNL